jgi:hypothetical protein
MTLCNLVYKDYKCLINPIPSFSTGLNNTHILEWYSNARKAKKWEESEIKNQTELCGLLSRPSEIPHELSQLRNAQSPGGSFLL